MNNILSKAIDTFSKGIKNTKEAIGSMISRAAKTLRENDLKREKALEEKNRNDAKFLIERGNQRKREEQMKQSR